MESLEIDAQIYSQLIVHKDVKTIDYIFESSFLGVHLRVHVNPIPRFNISALMSMPYCLNYCSFVISFEIERCEFPNFVLLFQDCFVYYGSLKFQYGF